MIKQIIYDIIAIAVFAVLARFAHPPVTLTGIFDAFWPWTLGALVGWAIIKWVLGPKNNWAQGAIVWISAIIGGMILWTIVNGKLPHYSFLIVATVASAILLFGRRAISQAISRKRLSSGR